MSGLEIQLIFGSAKKIIGAKHCYQVPIPKMARLIRTINYLLNICTIRLHYKSDNTGR